MAGMYDFPAIQPSKWTKGEGFIQPRWMRALTEKEQKQNEEAVPEPYHNHTQQRAPSKPSDIIPDEPSVSIPRTGKEVFNSVAVPDPNPLNRQIGGSHYKELKIQPIEYIVGNDLNWCEGNIVKYITRHKQKGGRRDVEKVIHYAQMLLEMEYEADDG